MKTPKFLKKKPNKKVVLVSGGFDPVHIGHVRMFNEAKRLGDYLIVLINNDNWLALKKGYVFMPESERVEIIESFSSVDEVRLTSHKKGTNDLSVCDDLEIIRPDIFANGGDRFKKNIPEVKICRKIKCEMVFNVGLGGKVQSSSELVDKAKIAQEKFKK